MPAINFQDRFASMVQDGSKRQTIRRERRRPIRPGDRLVLYAGLRTKKARKLLEDKCKRASKIEIGERYVKVDGNLLDPLERTALAVADGFLGPAGFYEFFRERYGLPFKGVLIGW